MLAVLAVVLPVFLVVGAGWLAVRLGAFPDSGVKGLMLFTQNFAIPALLFRAVYDLDLGAVSEPGLFISFYGGALICFCIGYLTARRGFGRRPGESVAIGFGAFFSNSVLLGLPIVSRAYGEDALAPSFALVALHAPFCYLVGIVAMEVARADGRGLGATLAIAAQAIFSNALTLGIALGFALNLGDFALPAAVSEAIDMMVRAALPAALFGLGGVLARYAVSASLDQALATTLISTMIHPALVWLFATQIFALPEGFTRPAVVMAAMAPGVNAYLFASMYDRAVGAAASTVMIATAASIFTTVFWLWALGGARLG